MRGLILKDLYMTWKYCKAIIFVSAIFMISSIFIEGSVFFSVYPIVIAGIIPFTIIVYEERFKWAAYRETLPVTRKQAVTAKYMLSLICIAVAVICTVIFMITKIIIREVDIWTTVSTAIFTIPLALIGPSVMLPFIFKYDVEKARLVYYVVVGTICGISVFFSLDYRIPYVPAGVTLLIGIIIFAFSWFVSVKIYENKEL